MKYTFILFIHLEVCVKSSQIIYHPYILEIFSYITDSSSSLKKDYYDEEEILSFNDEDEGSIDSKVRPSSYKWVVAIFCNVLKIDNR